MSEPRFFELVKECEDQGFSLDLCYDNGKYIPGKFINQDGTYDEDNVVQGPCGWTIEIGGYSDDELRSLYETIAEGFQLLRYVMSKREANNE